MADSEKMISYRIGEYARKMGVTPDFLKYYEQLGVVRSETRENGYHYYSFDQSYKILECMRLKSYGFSVRGMEAVFNDDMRTVQEKMDAQIQELEEKVTFEQRVIAEHRTFSDWLNRMEGKSTDWCIEWGDEMLFLPHTDGRSFLDDPRIYEILKDWIGEMPMVKSCMELIPPFDHGPFRPETHRFRWGMSVKRSYAEENHLPVNDAVKYLPRRKLFKFFFNNPGEAGSSQLPLEAAMEQLNTLGLKARGKAYITLLMYANIKNDTQRCGVISVPIDR